MGIFDKVRGIADATIDIIGSVKNAKYKGKKLSKEEFNLLGMSYFEDNFPKLMDSNQEFKSLKKTIKKNGHVGKRIFKYKYTELNARLSFNEGKPYTRFQVFSKNLSVGYIKEEDHSRIKFILDNDCTDSMNVKLSGGEFRIIGNDDSDMKSDIGYKAKLIVTYYK